jgi:phage terminase large subunit-like protein
MFIGWLREHLTAAGMQELSGEEVVARLSDADISSYLKIYDAELWEQKYRKFANLFPDEYRRIGDGEWSEYFPRHLYPRHMEFFSVGKKFDERCFMAGNRVGKTVVGGYEMTAHLTGLYPAWWVGKRFRHPIRAIAAGKTNETTRDIVQSILLGDVEWRGPRKTVDGSGIIPTELIGRDLGQLSWKQGSADLVDMIRIRHASGGWSKLNLKSYQQGRGAFEGTAQHVVWVDEEPELEVYDEARIRTMTTNGICLLTYTPLEGLTDTVLSFLPAAMRPATNEALNQNDWGNWN